MADFSESLYIKGIKGNFFGSCPLILGKKQENAFFSKKVAQKFGGTEKKSYLCTRNSEMMLTLTKISCRENEAGCSAAR